MKKLIFTVALTLSLVSVSQALEGNATDGQAKSAMCAACHGADGNSLIPMYPSLAEQHPQYIEKQLSDFKKGATSGGKEGRQDPVMAGMVMALSEQDMADLAAFYASQTLKPGNGTANEEGRALFNQGDVARGITACSACHGLDGAGLSSAGFPAVKSQSVDYLKSQLSKFKTGARANDMNGMMSTVSRKLKEKDMEALAQYMSSLK